MERFREYLPAQGPKPRQVPLSPADEQDILNEIEESAKTLGHSRSNTPLVFCRSSVEDQITVTRKALAYVEHLITSTCGHMLRAVEIAGNPVQAYLNTLPLSQVCQNSSLTLSLELTTVLVVRHLSKLCRLNTMLVEGKRDVKVKEN